MPRRSLERLALAWVPGEGPVDIQPLESGLLNDSFRVVRGGRTYALRVARPAPTALRVDREWECRVAAWAAVGGVGPTIRRCEPQAGILVADWIPGRSWSDAELRRPESIVAMAQLLRRVHCLGDLPQPVRVVRPAEWIARYADELQRAERIPHHASAALRDSADALLGEIADGAPAAVLCHGDLHRLNVSTAGSLLLFDWEYAHLTDPYWDLAGWVANNDAGSQFALDLLAAYLRRTPEPGEAARLQRFTWIYDYVCLLWGELYLCRGFGKGADAVSARATQLARRLRRAPGGPAG